MLGTQHLTASAVGQQRIGETTECRLAALTLPPEAQHLAHMPPHNDGYLPHDLQVLEFGEMVVGNWSKARAPASEVAAVIDGVRWYFARARAHAEARTGRNGLDSLAGSPKPQGRIASDLVHLSLALAHHDPSRSRRVRAQFVDAWRNADVRLTIADLLTSISVECGTDHGDPRGSP